MASAPGAPEEENGGEHNPAAAYQARAAALLAQQSRGRRRDRRLGLAKVLVALGLLGLGIAAVASRSPAAAWGLLPVAAVLAGLASWHERVLLQLAGEERGLGHYQRALRRLAGQWQGEGEDGAGLAGSDHPYARDLDIFGPASLFQLLSLARTTTGQSTLAGWLLAPAPPPEVAARQGAVAELRPALGLRQRLAMLPPERLQAAPGTLTAWAEGAPQAAPGAAANPAPMFALAIAWVFSVVVWAFWGLAVPIAILTLINLLIWWRHRDWAFAAAEAAQAAAPGLPLLEAVPALLLEHSFGCPKLAALAAGLPPRNSAAGPRPLHQLRRRLAWLEARQHMLIRFLDPVLLWSPLAVALLERWRQHFGPLVRGWLAAIGEFEALLSLANYAFEHPTDAFPSVAAEHQQFAAQGLGHPLLPEAAIRNDLTFGLEPRLLILSGPNMAGKSTLLRAVGLNAVLAQCGAPVRACRLQMPPWAVAACITTQDSLRAGISGFAAEILRLKQLAGIAAVRPTLVLVDELLRGTNPEDRRRGAAAVFATFLARGAAGIITTHDPAITHLAATMAPELANFHLGGGQLETADLVFDYHLHAGPASAGNALALMRNLGFPLAVPEG